MKSLKEHRRSDWVYRSPCLIKRVITRRSNKQRDAQSARRACVPKGKSLNSIKGHAFFGHGPSELQPFRRERSPPLWKMFSLENWRFFVPSSPGATRFSTLMVGVLGCAGGFLHKVHTYRYRSRAAGQGVRRWRPHCPLVSRLPCYPLSLCKCVTRARADLIRGPLF